MKLIFMGTPDFAVPSLEILYNAGYDIAAVITSVDKYGGRGRKQLIESAVKKFAVEKGLKVLQPKNLKSPKFVEELRALNADLQIVVAFRMLPVVVWDMPPLGTYNLHGSLLPKYRGAAPINWAVIRGEKETGVTSFKLKHEIDTGSILMSRNTKIYDDENASAVHDRMKYIAADVVLETVQTIQGGDYTLHEQDESGVTKAPKLNSDNTKLDFDKDIEVVHNMVRGLSLYPCAWMELGTKKLKVYASEIERENHGHKTGLILSDNKVYIKVSCQNGFLHIKELQLTGKRRMKVGEFLNGFDMAPYASK